MTAEDYIEVPFKGRLAWLSPITCCGHMLWLYAAPGSFAVPKSVRLRQVVGEAALEPLPAAQEATGWGSE